MPKTVIKIENLSKLYRIGEIGTGTISHDLNRWWTTKIRGKEDPYAQVGQVNDRTSKAKKGEHVWALKDINLEVKQGDILGIIGKNGAGKSTLLKLLSRVTSPTTGSIKVKGRLASLLEVGTGFHPEMTGRENIYMNGTIMGMRRWEIDKKLDEIVDFAGIEKYLDTPTKRYSSGMTVRLGFAIAAFLEPEILVVDEVLAVGDAEFQKKAIGKMQDVSKGEGRTVLFVSHNLNSVRALCHDSMLLKNGRIISQGETNQVLDIYLNEQEKMASSGKWENKRSKIPNKIQLKHITITDKKFNIKTSFLTSEDIYLNFCFDVLEDIKNSKIGFDLVKNDSVVFRSQQVDSFEISNFYSGVTHKLCVQIPKFLLNEGYYRIRPIMSIHCVESLLDFYEDVLTFQVSIDAQSNEFHTVLNETNHPGMIFPKLKWNELHTH